MVSGTLGVRARNTIRVMVAVVVTLIYTGRG